ncbi:hypothetical protein Nepgr_000518 [Nepenthes gracilis]|uniref:Uncharacterized protein n=1 Tax=Nepenthes gracilis TaxID=150966 RepID=A0AAD3P334_NEPGR|nr:hypothetical protein Nepgr_000518 [Nepenthes gracilis]
MMGNLSLQRLSDRRNFPLRSRATTASALTTVIGVGRSFCIATSAHGGADFPFSSLHLPSIYCPGPYEESRRQRGPWDLLLNLGPMGEKRQIKAHRCNDRAQDVIQASFGVDHARIPEYEVVDHWELPVIFKRLNEGLILRDDALEIDNGLTNGEVAFHIPRLVKQLCHYKFVDLVHINVVACT